MTGHCKRSGMQPLQHQTNSHSKGKLTGDQKIAVERHAICVRHAESTAAAGARAGRRAALIVPHTQRSVLLERVCLQLQEGKRATNTRNQKRTEAQKQELKKISSINSN